MSYRATRSANIYKTESNTYRVRLMKNNTKISKNFSRFRDAIQFRNELNQAN